MSKISFDVKSIENIRSRVNDLYRRVDSIENSLSSIRNSLDCDIRNRNGIDRSYRTILEDISDRKMELLKTEHFLTNTIKSYKDADHQIMVKLNMISDTRPKENDAYDKLKHFILSNKKLFLKLLNIYYKKILMKSPFFLFSAKLRRLLTILIALGIKLVNELEKPESDKIDIPTLDDVLEYSPNEYNPDVLAMQRRLNDLGYTDANGNKLEEDGFFGPKTLEAVNKYKEDYDLWNYGDMEGKVGKTTWKHMFTNPKVPYTPEIDDAGQPDESGTQPPSGGTIPAPGNVPPGNTPPVTPNNETITQMMNNLRNDTSLNLSQEKKDSMIIMGTTLLNEGYDPAFVAGVLANILAEGTAGKFESSNYSSNPSAEPDYLRYMDSNYNYRNEFSGKNISEVGVAKTYNLLKELERNGYTGKFGLGCVQWTGSRTMGLINCYIEVCGMNGYPTKEQCLQAESLFIAREFNQDYHRVYEKWESQYKNTDNAAYGAGSVVCTDYEVPADRYNKAVTRGNNSTNIYNVMMGS